MNINAYEFGEPAILASKRAVNSVKMGRLQVKRAWYRAGPNSSDLESTNQVIFKTMKA